MKSAEVREAFLKYFEQQGHQRVASSSLIPGNDPTLLFTNAGMVQFKDVFLGDDQRPYSRATSAQRCVRAGGKHNDLENVGYTARHHTFFEMLGNFSFGDYFKHEAIRYAWQFLTEVLGLPEEKLWVTVHVSDDEAADIWLQDIGVSAERFSRLDEDNFWQMGDTGPCGPSSEIFYDHGESVFGGPPGSENDDGDRYIEIWNLVFMQFQRSADGSLTPLPNPSIDTGMGLERIAAVMQGVHSNYQIDLFRNLLAAVVSVTGATDASSQSLRVIADHIRSCAFLIIDGVIPGNEGRDYVLRRILRRAIRHGHRLGVDEPFFYRLVAPLAAEMGDAYPELRQQQGRVERVILGEEQQFAATLEHGMAILNEAIAELQGKEIPGDIVFKLYDTYGFPVDLTNDIAREHHLTLDLAGYEKSMAAQRERSREGGHFRVDYSHNLKLDGETEFTGYRDRHGLAKVVALLRGDARVESLVEGEEGSVVLDKTPFYAESGGQAGDSGYLQGDETAEALRFDVVDTTKAGAVHVHHGKLLQGALHVGDTVNASIDANVRCATALNHSATHLLHAALRQVLGTHVSQKGSLVDSQRLRFDFSHNEAVTVDELRRIEALVNQQIRANTSVQVDITDMESARNSGAMALFGEKYGDEVRVLTMGNGFSVELCGGTHVERSGDIGLMRIVSESGISSGVRRIEALTGAVALARFDQLEQQLETVGAILKTGRDNVAAKVEQLLASQRKLEKELEKLQGRLAGSTGADLAASAQEIGGIKVLAAQLDTADGKTLRTTMDQLKNKLGAAAIILAGVDGDKVALVAGVTKAESARVKAGDMLSMVARQIGGKGGGRPDMAQGGGGDPAGVPAALQSVSAWVAQQLGT
jgi:alanyl-tRNA synthetase